ncbi:hypothetical protein H9P43_007347 [Blastocladiella emersonii ATCC 22665]|nr:hypothetical protein H9P43_007347 [Blastocladiella emersonii ATCC 22665]
MTDLASDVPTVRIDVVVTTLIDELYSGPGIWDFDSEKLPAHFSVICPANTTWRSAVAAIEATPFGCIAAKRDPLYWQLSGRVAGTDLRLTADGLLADPDETLAQLVAASSIAPDLPALKVPRGAVIVVQFAPIQCADLFKIMPAITANRPYAFTSSDYMQVESLLPDMFDLANQLQDPARARSAIDAAAAAYLVSTALIPKCPPDLRHEYRMIARGRRAPDTFVEWCKDWASGKWKRELVWLCDPDAPSFKAEDGSSILS